MSKTTPKPPKPTRAKHPFPKVVFLSKDENSQHLDGTWYGNLDVAAAGSAEYVAEYGLLRVRKVNRGVTFEEVK